MKRKTMGLAGIALAFMLVPCMALAFDSGSTGVDGDFNPIVSTEIALPPNGILNYRSVNIPTGVTVTFKRNAANTPVVMLVQGNATIAGRIDVSGSDGASTGSAADGSLTAEGIPGRGGPGGFDGGRGARPGPAVAGPLGSTFVAIGGAGLGPGGGGGGLTFLSSPPAGAIEGGVMAVGGGGFRFSGATGGLRIKTAYDSTTGGRQELVEVEGGKAYGNDALVPLIGGSGGGGGASGTIFHGAGGGGGGGAILVATSGKLVLTGSILANGGSGGKIKKVILSEGLDANGCGGSGSGGAVRLTATTLDGNGAISVDGGSLPIDYCGSITGGGASAGRVRTEAEFASRLVDGLPGPIYLTGDRTLRFSTVAGTPVPAIPTGSNDVTVPTDTTNPVTVALATSGIPVGSIVKVTVTPQYGGPPISVDSPPTAGSLDSATTSVSLDIPPGHSVLSAQTTFMVLAAVGDALSRFAQGERVEKVTLTSTLGQGEKATLHTVAGKQFEVEPALLKLAALLK
jgi:hypothetical protein